MMAQHEFSNGIGPDDIRRVHRGFDPTAPENQPAAFEMKQLAAFESAQRILGRHISQTLVVSSQQETDLDL